MNPETGDVAAKGLCERIGIDGRLTHKVEGKKIEKEIPMPTHGEAIAAVMAALLDAEHGVIKSVDEIDAVGHRVLHGGMKFSDSCVINDTVIATIEECTPLGPLHIPANLLGIRACQEAMPGTPNVAVFDTAFHMTMPAKAYRYAIPTKYFEEADVRRYGFHGTSHKYVALRTAELVGKKEFKMVNCHLGNGSSMAAILNGKCQDTTMGLTPLAGVPMGTRSGDIDGGVIQFLCNKYGMSVDECLNVLNKKSGMLGMSGVSSDFRDLEDGAKNGNADCQLALDKFAYEVAKYVGAYAAALNGLDVLTFTAGVGENGISTRADICEYLGYLGVKIDPEKNNVRGKEALISTPDSKVQVWVVPTNEELMIARDTAELVAAK
jgi:acetate kinase